MESISSAVASRRNIRTDVPCWPRSIRAIAEWLVPIDSASSCSVSPSLGAAADHDSGELLVGRKPPRLSSVGGAAASVALRPFGDRRTDRTYVCPRLDQNLTTPIRFRSGKRKLALSGSINGPNRVLREPAGVPRSWTTGRRLTVRPSAPRRSPPRRVARTVFPARLQLVATMNLCRFGARV